MNKDEIQISSLNFFVPDLKIVNSIFEKSLGLNKIVNKKNILTFVLNEYTNLTFTTFDKRENQPLTLYAPTQKILELNKYIEENFNNIEKNYKETKLSEEETRNTLVINLSNLKLIILFSDERLL